MTRRFVCWSRSILSCFRAFSSATKEELSDIFRKLVRSFKPEEKESERIAVLRQLFIVTKNSEHVRYALRRPTELHSRLVRQVTFRICGRNISEENSFVS